MFLGLCVNCARFACIAAGVRFFVFFTSRFSLTLHLVEQYISCRCHVADGFAGARTPHKSQVKRQSIVEDIAAYTESVRAVLLVVGSMSLAAPQGSSVVGSVALSLARDFTRPILVVKVRALVGYEVGGNHWQLGSVRWVGGVRRWRWMRGNNV